MIKKTARGYQVVSEEGKPLSADNLTHEQAQHRLAQVEYFKHKSQGKDQPPPSTALSEAMGQ